MSPYGFKESGSGWGEGGKVKLRSGWKRSACLTQKKTDRAMKKRSRAKALKDFS